MSEYVFSLESGSKNYPEIERLYRRHYAEMKVRLESQGVMVADYNPRLKQYFEAWDSGWLLNFIVRLDGEAVGYSNVYLTNDMHNGELIATEDTIYILPEHRNGVGRRLVKHILEHLRSLEVKRVNVNALTDLRVAKLWNRMGFKHVAHSMTYTF